MRLSAMEFAQVKKKSNVCAAKCHCSLKKNCDFFVRELRQLHGSKMVDICMKYSRNKLRKQNVKRLFSVSFIIVHIASIGRIRHGFTHCFFRFHLRKQYSILSFKRWLWKKMSFIVSFYLVDCFCWLLLFYSRAKSFKAVSKISIRTQKVRKSEREREKKAEVQAISRKMSIWLMMMMHHWLWQAIRKMQSIYLNL